MWMLISPRTTVGAAAVSTAALGYAAHVLAVTAELVDGQLIARASTRGLAERLGFLSKDSAHRRLRELRRAGVLDALPSTGPMDPPTYVLHLDGTGITVTHPDLSR